MYILEYFYFLYLQVLPKNSKQEIYIQEELLNMHSIKYILHFLIQGSVLRNKKQSYELLLGTWGKVYGLIFINQPKISWAWEPLSRG